MGSKRPKATLGRPSGCIEIIRLLIRTVLQLVWSEEQLLTACGESLVLKGHGRGTHPVGGSRAAKALRINAALAAEGWFLPSFDLHHRLLSGFFIFGAPSE